MMQDHFFPSHTRPTTSAAVVVLACRKCFVGGVRAKSCRVLLVLGPQDFDTLLVLRRFLVFFVVVPPPFPSFFSPPPLFPLPPLLFEEEPLDDLPVPVPRRFFAFVLLRRRRARESLPFSLPFSSPLSAAELYLAG